MKSHYWMSCIVAGAATLSSPVFAGHAEGNGGDVVYCKPSPKNAFSGYYALDQLMSGVVEVPSSAPEAWMDKLIEIHQAIKSGGGVDPEQDGIASDFHQLMLAAIVADTIGRYQWKAAPGPLVPLHDENLVERLPSNCQEKGIMQAVRRVQVGRSIKFVYDAELFGHLRVQGTRLAWLVVHEWLWSFLDDAEKVRTATTALLTDPPTATGLQELLTDLMEDHRVLPEPGVYLKVHARRPHDCAIEFSSGWAPSSIVMRGVRDPQWQGLRGGCNLSPSSVDLQCKYRLMTGKTHCFFERNDEWLEVLSPTEVMWTDTTFPSQSLHLRKL